MAFLLLLLLLFPCQSPAQQPYVNNKQLNCNLNDTTTLGFVCNAAATSCPSYLTFRSTPTYNTPATIADLLSADASQIASANNVADVDLLPDDTLVIVPVNCSCSRNYYQHNASYLLKQRGETYFTVANDTYQALTTCQAMEAQNPYNFRELYPGLRLNVPLRCACPTPNQTASGFKYLLTYLIRQGNTYESIASAFSGAGADVQGILAANELNVNQLIFFFTPILVPLKTEPTKENINAVPSPPPSFSLPHFPPSPLPARTTVPGSGFSSAWESELRSWFCLPQSLRFGIRSAIETLTVYKFEDVDKATESFAESNRINGSSVYHGSFKGDAAAVKIMKGDVSSEIDVLRQIKHSNILRLSGFCLHQGITYLVYEYAEKGSLSEWLRPTKDSIDSERRLDWKQRVQVAYDVADALNYLHNFTNPPYIHKNLKSSNILLDGNLRAKVANFGLARILDTDDQTVMTRHVVGTYGYMAPEYIENGLVTPKLDVFAFGCIHGVLDGENVRENLRVFMDPWLGEEYPLELAYSMAQLARSCVANNLDARPPLSEVFMALSKLLLSCLEWDPSHETSLSLSE
ncbi:UNVERIFIED_CONTAM: protein LYK5 [Sesamum calycinum]|uniref:non-specific serine/threonine protein kinase n=1 Tax=Sesamum calycinum TaxID=2727403 RepID=A0AAW2P937_9LAMI